MPILRRDLVKSALALSAVSMLPTSISQAIDLGPAISRLLPSPWSNGIPPLYVTAYIDPTIASQKGQEPVVAKFPLAIVGQRSSIVLQQWLDKVRSINPSIKLLAYQNVNGENSVSSPGNDILNKIKNQDVWVSYSGITPKAFEGRRLYDPRKVAWQNAFLDACDAAYRCYGYDGLFLDNCTVFNIAAPLPSVRTAMLNSLNEVLIKLRQRLPNAIIIGNGADHFPSLNGAMNEGRPQQLAAEVAARNHKSPIINLYQYITDMRNPNEAALKANFELALRNKCFFGLAHTDDYQHIHWPELFDKVMDAYRTNPNPPKMTTPVVN